MIGNLLLDQPIAPKRTTSMVPPGMGELNYLQSLLGGVNTQELFPGSAPTFAALTLSGLTPSMLTGTNAGRTLVSVTPGVSLSWTGTALNTIQNIRATDSPTFAGLTLTSGAGASKVWTSDADGAGSWAFPAAPAAHVLDGALHTVSGLTAGQILRATAATTFGWSTLTIPDTAAIGTILHASAANVISALAAGATGEYLKGNTGAAPTWATLNQAAVAGLTATDSPTFESIGIHDTNDSHHLFFAAGSDLAADRILTLTTGDAARTITLSGDPTLGDWFDQSVKQASSPTFAGMTLTGFSGIVKATAGVLSAAALVDADIPDDITLTNITQITNRSHTNLTDIGTLTHATIDSYLDQAVKTTSNPTFDGVSLKSGTTYSHSAIAGYMNNYTNVTGAIVFTCSGASTYNTMLKIEFEGYNYTANSVWRVIFGGFWYGDGATWHYPVVYYEGTPPFTSIRCMYDASGDPCIALGETGAVWQYPQILMNISVAGYYQTSLWSSWTSALVTSLAAYTIIATRYANQLYLPDGGGNFLGLYCGSTLTANRTITFTPGDADRTITLSGNPTLADWFDQAVKTTSTVQFADLTVNHSATPTLSLQNSTAIASLSSGDSIGRIYFGGGTYNMAAILGNVDGTPGAGDHPSRLTFWTTPDAGTTLTERIRIDSAGRVGIGTGTSLAKLSINGGVHVGGDADPGDNNLSVDGTIALTGTLSNHGAYTSTYHIDTNSAAISVVDGGTVAIPNFSGMVIVNNHTSGPITIYLCGGGNVTVVATAGTQVGTMAYSSGNAGYTWTSNYGSTATYGFCIIRTRASA